MSLSQDEWIQFLRAIAHVELTLVPEGHLELSNMLEANKARIAELEAEVGQLREQIDFALALHAETAQGADIDEMRSNFQKTKTYMLGDAKLMWVSEGWWGMLCYYADVRARAALAPGGG